MKDRRCETCAWGGEVYTVVNPPFSIKKVTCRFDRVPVNNHPDHFCRHWSETTGWDVFEKQRKVDLGFEELQKQLRIAKGLLRIASELFEKDVAVLNFQKEIGNVDPGDAHQLGVRERWLEEYHTKC